MNKEVMFYVDVLCVCYLSNATCCNLTKIASVSAGHA